MSHAITRTIRVVAAVVVRDGLVMVTQRAADCPRWPDLWEFPGGKVEPGETDRDALERELEEELDVRVEVGRQVTRVELDRGNGELLDFRAYRCEIVDGEPECIEVQAIRWLPAEALSELPMPPADLPVVATLQASGW